MKKLIKKQQTVYIEHKTLNTRHTDQQNTQAQEVWRGLIETVSAVPSFYVYKVEISFILSTRTTVLDNLLVTWHGLVDGCP